MSIQHHSSAQRAALALVALATAPFAVAQERPDATPSRPSESPTVDLKDYTPGLSPAQLAEIEARDAADLALSPARIAPVVERPRDAEANAAVRRARRFEQVVFDTTAQPGTVWAVGQGWKAHFTPAGITYIPRLGKAAPTNYPTSFELARVARGGEALAFRAGRVTQSGTSVTLERGALREVYHLEPAQLEQTFVFDTLDGTGDLVVEMTVDSAWQVIPGEDYIRFVDEAWGEVRYGRAYALDAAGARVEIAREWTGEGIALTVPAAFLADAVLPLTIDPTMGSQYSNTYGTTDDDSSPDAAFESSSGQYWFSWEDYTSATDADVYASSITTGGVQGTTVSVDLTTNYWDSPVIAASPANQRVMVAASTTPNGPGTANAAIEGRLIDTAARANAGAAFVIDTQTQDCRVPDIGGSWWTGASFADFCVVWQREFNATDFDILARIINADGTFETSVIFLSNSGANNDFAPAVSKCRGDESNPGDFWNIAWIRDADGNGEGTPFCHRIYYDGTLNGAVEQSVFATAFASHVDVSSTFDRTVPTTGDRPFVVAFERNLSTPDVYATVCTQNAVFSTSNVSDMEDFDVALESHDPSIATDGTSIFLAFDELWWGAGPGSTDLDTYMLSGGIGYGSGTARVALGERHVQLDYIGGRQDTCTVTSRWDGGGGTDDGLVIWEDHNGANGSTLKLQQLDVVTGEGSIYQSIGAQYCAANAHGDSSEGGRRSSFISARGNASVGSTQILDCDEMKLNAFAYFIVSTTTGNVNMPGSSQGRLCLGGTIGRVVGGSILNTGASGSISTIFNPLSLPTPNGSFSAAPGQTLYFQCWHRDVLGGLATSNFSNACSITFLP